MRRHNYIFNGRESMRKVILPSYFSLLSSVVLTTSQYVSSFSLNCCSLSPSTQHNTHQPPTQTFRALQGNLHKAFGHACSWTWTGKWEGGGEHVTLTWPPVHASDSWSEWSAWAAFRPHSGIRVATISVFFVSLSSLWIGRRCPVHYFRGIEA